MNPLKKIENNVIINLNSSPIVFDYIQNGITITDENSTILYTNPGFSRITGYTKEEAKGNNPGILHSGRHELEFFQKMWSDIKNKGFWEGEIWNRRKTGEVYPEYLTISKICHGDSDHYYYMAVFSDISYLEKDVEKKLYLAFYDPLTELPNRNLYMDRVNKTIELAKAESQKAVVIFYMDLDKFKQVNDTYGHFMGDQLLKAVGKRLKSITRAEDTIARIGGDEFAAILISDCKRDSVLEFAKRIVNDIEKPFLINDHEINVSISIGISFYPQDTDKVETLLSNADKAMYIAKKSKSQIEFHK